MNSLTILDNAQSMPYFLPETILTVGAMAIFVIDLFLQSSRRRIPIIAVSSIAFLAAAALATYYASFHPYLAETVARRFRTDPFRWSRTLLLDSRSTIASPRKRPSSTWSTVGLPRE